MLNTSVPCIFATFCFLMSGPHYEAQKRALDGEKEEAVIAASQVDIDERMPLNDRMENLSILIGVKIQNKIKRQNNLSYNPANTTLGLNLYRDRTESIVDDIVKAQQNQQVKVVPKKPIVTQIDNSNKKFNISRDEGRVTSIQFTSNTDLMFDDSRGSENSMFYEEEEN